MFPLLSRSGVLQRMISEYQPPADGGGGGMCTLQLDDIPGGAKAFELAAKFCYDVKIELNALNVVCLRCAAEYLRMTDDYAEGNLITQAESFLADVLANWKDSIKALETCEGVLPTAEDLHLISRCITALASRACASDAAAPLVRNASVVDKDALWNGIRSGDTVSAAVAVSGMDWWYEDVSFLSLPMFKRLIQAMEAKGMRAESIAGAIMFYAGRFLPGLKRDTSFSNALASYGAEGSGGGGGMSSRNITPRAASVSAPSEGDQRYFLEEIVALLPTKKGVASTKFLLGMLRKAMLLHASPLCRENLERRIGAQLEDASLDDLLVPNLGYHVETLYDIDCVQRILDYFMSSTDGIGTGYTSPALAEEGGGSLGIPQGGTPSSSLSPITMVARLMDGFLAEVAPDTNLKLPKFQALAAVVPDYARPVDDGIYRATDIYLKSHPWLSESEREQLCRLLNCQKLSLEACTHAAQNERLPLRVVVQVLFFEQLRLRTSITGWFFVSDNAPGGDGARPHSGGAIVPKGAAAIVGSAQAEADSDVEGDAPEGKETITDVKVRVSELEKECKSMKQEIRRLGKPRRSWSLLPKKCGLGAKVQQAQTAMSGK
ncbi:BTB/POZ domain-containing protein At5g03250-like isoform X2 [Miscanthus floridulus]|uniref:BTB/POZ domain-containing protein At5g03250-like isoform X2 n=1 Tax=Miscanthus floridulus TaxID=154761 RepID=UPI00345A992B